MDVASLNQRTKTVEISGYHPTSGGYKIIASFIADTLGSKINQS